jgi:hypothetical protein
VKARSSQQVPHGTGVNRRFTRVDELTWMTPLTASNSHPIPDMVSIELRYRNLIEAPSAKNIKTAFSAAL